MDTKDLLATMDSGIWADEFCRIVGEKIPAIRDERCWVATWFANAIMTGYDEGKRQRGGTE